MKLSKKVIFANKKALLLFTLFFLIQVPLETFAGKESLPGSKGSLSSSSSNDKTAPNAPNSIEITDDSGEIVSNSTTQDTTPTLKGKAEANSKVTLNFYSGSTFTGSAKVTANRKGIFTYTQPIPLEDGVYSVKATATDSAGNISSKSSAVSITVDSTSPDAPTSLATTSSTTNDSTPTITGNSEPNSKVTLFIDSSTLGTTTADSKGAFSFTPSSAISDGTYSIKATSTDSAGNVSSESSSLSITIDTAAPDAPTSLTNISDDNDSTPTISGTAEPNSTITLKIGDTVLGTGTADSAGNFSITITSELDDGIYLIKATATDEAGNVSLSSSLSITIDSATSLLVQNNLLSIVTTTSNISTAVNSDTSIIGGGGGEPVTSITNVGGEAFTSTTTTTESGNVITSTVSSESQVGTTQITFTGSESSVTLTIANSTFSPIESIVVVRSITNANSAAFNSIEGAFLASATPTTLTDALASAGVSADTISTIKSSLGSGQVTITLSPAVTQLIINNVVKAFSATSISSQTSAAIANLSPSAAVAMETLISAVNLDSTLAVTIVPTALNDALVAITAEILQIQSEGGQVPPELEALAQELEKIKATAIPSLEVAE